MKRYQNPKDWRFSLGLPPTKTLYPLLKAGVSEPEAWKWVVVLTGILGVSLILSWPTGIEFAAAIADFPNYVNASIGAFFVTGSILVMKSWWKRGDRTTLADRIELEVLGHLLIAIGSFALFVCGIAMLPTAMVTLSWSLSITLGSLTRATKLAKNRWKSLKIEGRED